MSKDELHLYFFPLIVGLAVAASGAKAENRTFVLQDGTFNKATSVQDGQQNQSVTAQGGDFNTSRIDQGGRSNVAAIVQSGDGLEASIEQRGVRQAETVFQADTYRQPRSGSTSYGNQHMTTTVRFDLR